MHSFPAPAEDDRGQSARNDRKSHVGSRGDKVNPPKPPLNTAQLAQLARAALDNAGGLLSDARVLLGAGRWPRAYALAVLAAEEYGKFYSCVAAAYYDSDDAARWDRFWSDFTSHRPKLRAWAGQLVDLQDWGPVGSEGDGEWEQAWENRRQAATAGHFSKLAALYVDVVDGTLRVPEVLVNEKAARDIVRDVAAVIEPSSRMFEGDLTPLFSPRPEVREVFSRMLKAKSKQDRLAVFGDVLNLLGRG